MSQMKKVEKAFNILAFGEVLWDILPSGPKLGGAPVNFLYHAHLLGDEIQIITRIGNDQLGRDISSEFKKLNIPTDFLQVSSTAPTGYVTVSLSENGNPTYQIIEGVAWDEIQIDQKILNKALHFIEKAEKTAFYFGSLALRTIENRISFERLVTQLPRTVLRVCDLNLRAPFYSKEIVELTLNHANVFKLNDIEAIELDAFFADRFPPSLSAIADSEGGLGGAICSNKEATDKLLKQWSEKWRKAFGLSSIILTCGAHGAYLFHEGDVSFTTSVPVTVVDAVGAGDSFAAVCIAGLLREKPLDQIVEAAAKRAAFVCSHHGATPFIPREELNPFKD